MATFTVTTGQDVVNTGDGVLSLREAPAFLAVPPFRPAPSDDGVSPAPFDPRSIAIIRSGPSATVVLVQAARVWRPPDQSP